MIEKGITEIENALEKAVRRDCSSNVTVSFSGGIDSTLVAYLAKKHTNVELIAVGIEDSHDIEAAESAAKLIDSKLSIITMNEDKEEKYSNNDYDNNDDNLTDKTLFMLSKMLM